MSIVKPGQIRCGEHTDYGAVTLLFQDEIGGLEVHVQCDQVCIKKSFVLRVFDFVWVLQKQAEI